MTLSEKLLMATRGSIGSTKNDRMGCSYELCSSEMSLNGKYFISSLTKMFCQYFHVFNFTQTNNSFSEIPGGRWVLPDPYGGK